MKDNSSTLLDYWIIHSSEQLLELSHRFWVFYDNYRKEALENICKTMLVKQRKLFCVIEFGGIEAFLPPLPPRLWRYDVIITGLRQ